MFRSVYVYFIETAPAPVNGYELNFEQDLNGTSDLIGLILNAKELEERKSYIKSF